MAFYTSLGTPAAADRILEIIFSEGRIEEWYEYGGEPHHFRAYIEMTGRPVTQESLVSFRRILASVKRLSSWWDGTITVTELDTDPILGGGRAGPVPFQHGASGPGPAVSGHSGSGLLQDTGPDLPPSGPLNGRRHFVRGPRRRGAC